MGVEASAQNDNYIRYIKEDIALQIIEGSMCFD